MTQQERDHLRDLQDRWLALPRVAKHIARWGWDEKIGTEEMITFRQVRDEIHPGYKWYFDEFLRGLR